MNLPTVAHITTTALLLLNTILFYRLELSGRCQILNQFREGGCINITQEGGGSPGVKPQGAHLTRPGVRRMKKLLLQEKRGEGGRDGV